MAIAVPKAPTSSSASFVSNKCPGMSCGDRLSPWALRQRRNCSQVAGGCSSRERSHQNGYAYIHSSACVYRPRWLTKCTATAPAGCQAVAQASGPSYTKLATCFRLLIRAVIQLRRKCALSPAANSSHSGLDRIFIGNTTAVPALAHGANFLAKKNVNPSRRHARGSGVQGYQPSSDPWVPALRFATAGMTYLNSPSLALEFRRSCDFRYYGWITVSVRLIRKASWRSRKSVTTSVKASGRSAPIAWPAS